MQRYITQSRPDDQIDKKDRFDVVALVYLEEEGNIYKTRRIGGRGELEIISFEFLLC
jgi:hypothetical protein